MAEGGTGKTTWTKTVLPDAVRIWPLKDFLLGLPEILKGEIL